MDWEKAKTILIIVLLFLNAGLFALNLYSKNENMLTAEEVETIKTILANNNIEVACALPTDNKPARPIILVGTEWDADYIKNTFFPQDNNVIRTNDSGDIIYRSGIKTVRVYNPLSEKKPLSLTYEGLLDKNDNTKGLETVSRYKAMLGDDFASFKLSRVTIEDGKETYLYNDTKKDKAIYCSYMIIELTDTMIVLNIKKYNFASYVESINQIYRADEALLAFMHYAKNAFKYKITIEGCTLGYNIDEQSNTETYKARLYYRIFIKGYAKPVYIDAITNTVVS